MWFELKTKLQNILINIIYRSERQSHHRFWDFLLTMLKNAMEESNHMTCMGDLNKNFLNLPSNINDLKIKQATLADILVQFLSGRLGSYI